MAIVKSVDQLALKSSLEEPWAQLVAQIRIDRGEAAEVLASFPIEREGNSPPLAVTRKLVIADAHAALGNTEAARSILGELVEGSGRRLLDELKAQARPIATIAASMLDGVAPYR